MFQLFRETDANAVIAEGISHKGEYIVKDFEEYLRSR